MARINIELPDELHTGAKVEAARQEITLKNYVVHTLADDLGIELEKETENQ